MLCSQIRCTTMFVTSQNYATTMFVTSQNYATVRRTRSVVRMRRASRARTFRCFPLRARLLAPSLLSFPSRLRSSLSAPGRMHEHTSADGLRVLRLQNT